MNTGDPETQALSAHKLTPTISLEAEGKTHTPRKEPFSPNPNASPKMSKS